MERFYQIAGLVWRILIPEGYTYRDEGALADYRTEGPRWDRVLEIRAVDRLPEPVGEAVFTDPGKWVYVSGDTQLRYTGTMEQGLAGACMCVRRQGNHSLLLVTRQSFPGRITQRTILNAMETEHHVVQHHGFLLHAACIRWQDRAILFTAPSGTGKSTQADLWCRLRGAELINGDRIAVFPDGTAEVPMIRGIPYAGSSGVCKNTTLPLAAIVCLRQAPVTTITPLTGFRAFRGIWEGCSVNVWNREDVQVCSETVMEVIQRTCVLDLACTPDESAVMALEQELERNGRILENQKRTDQA